MTALAAQIGPRQINQILIPGSHDSGTYSLAPILGLGPWSICQDQNITSQLNFGIRYFDLRFWKSRWSGDYRIFHGAYPSTGALLSNVLKYFYTFTSANTQEILILDFQEFANFETSDYSSVAESLQSQFGGQLAPYDSSGTTGANPTFTVDNIQTKNWQIIVLFNCPTASVFTNYSFLWPRSVISNPWANSDDLTSILYTVQASLPAANSKNFTVSQCVLTPWQAVGDSILEGAALNNPSFSGAVTRWGSRRFNIFLTDYVEYSLVPQIIAAQTSTLVQIGYDSSGNICVTNVQSSMSANLGPIPIVACAPNGNSGMHLLVLDETNTLWYTSGGNGNAWAGTFVKVSSVASGLNSPTPAVACASTSSGDLYVLVTDQTGSLWMTSLVSGTWSSYSAVPTQANFKPITQAVCATDSSGNLHLCIIDNAWNVWHSIYTASSGSWATSFDQVNSTGLETVTVASRFIERYGLHSFPGIAQLACVVDSNDGLNLCVLDGYGNLYHQIRSSGGSWSGYGNVQAQMAGEQLGAFAQVTCVFQSGSLYVNVTREDGTIWQTTRSLSTGSWTYFESLDIPCFVTQFEAALVGQNVNFCASVGTQPPSANALLAVYTGPGNLTTALWFDTANAGQSVVIPGVQCSTTPALAYIPSALADSPGFLYCVYKDAGSAAMNQTAYNGTAWGIGPVSITNNSTQSAPALANFPTASNLCCVYRDSTSSDALWFMTYDGLNWNKAAEIPNNQTGAAPTLVVYSGSLCCIYKGSGSGSQQLWMTSTPDCKTWSNGQKVTGAFSDQAPSAVIGSYASNSDLSIIIAFKNGGENDIQLISFASSSGFTAITSIPNCETSAAPVLSIYDNLLVCTYVDLSTSNLYYTLYDGSVWSTPSLLVPGVVSPTANVIANPYND
jgi:hypothetical protein